MHESGWNSRSSILTFHLPDRSTFWTRNLWFKSFPIRIMRNGTGWCPNLPTGVYSACRNIWKSCALRQGGDSPSSECVTVANWRGALHFTSATPGSGNRSHPGASSRTMASYCGDTIPGIPRKRHPDTSRSCHAWQTLWPNAGMPGSGSIAEARSPMCGRSSRPGGQPLRTIPISSRLAIGICSGRG
jgi:hypothetical protein